ncbi:uncharacterized protein METZ01_LOCUS247335 [marine metagenome]|uniref:APS kinase domain-containing protein n=1 Tax=marine metagenome TaxID=408172 RepID=A0A382I719_9ZZZZ
MHIKTAHTQTPYGDERSLFKIAAKRKILVMGLPGSGKTTFAKLLVARLNAVWFNADEVRETVNPDLGFTEEDRLKQAKRMGWMCDQVVKTGTYAVAEFICPTEETRNAFGPDYVIWVNSIEKGRYEDTNKLFVPPTEDARWDGNDLILEAGKTAEEWCDQAVEHLRTLENWNNKAPTALLIGRYQPFHAGHKTLVKEAIKRTGQCCIALRDVAGTDESNPYDFEKVAQNIMEACVEFGNKVTVVELPNITDVFYGRGVGYNIEELTLSDEIQKISATKIRAGDIDVHGQEKKG